MLHRILAAAIAAMASSSTWAADVFVRQWGVATVIPIVLPDYDTPADLATNADVAFVSGDVRYSCDEGTQVNVDADAGAGTEALPTEEGGAQYAQALTAVQMRCARIYLAYIDTATKVWMDTAVVIETYGCHTAQDPRGVIRCGTAQGGATQSITLDAGASSATDYYVGSVVRIIDGTGANQGDRTITAYNGTSKAATVNAAWLTTPDSTSVFQVFAEKLPLIAADANGVVQANVKQLDDDAGAAPNMEAFFDGSVFSLANVTIGTVTTLTGHTAQTGDAFARLGAPSGGSISADIQTRATAAAVAALPTAAQIRAEVMTYLIDGVQFGCHVAIISAYAGGPWQNSGLTTTHRNIANTVDRLSVLRTVDESSLSVSSYSCPSF